MALKSIHLTNAWHPRSGGIRTFYEALLAAANRAGHEMHLVVPSETTYTEQIGECGVIHHLRSPLAPGSASYRLLMPASYLIPGGAIWRILHEQQPDLVEICDKYTLNYLGGLLRLGAVPGLRLRPAVVALSCERFDDSVRNYLADGLVARWFASSYLRWLYFPLADHHIAVSRYVAAELKAISSGHKVDRGVWMGPMGVDYQFFAGSRDRAAGREALRKSVDAAGGDVLLVFAGRLAPEKNVPLLFKMMRVLASTDPKRCYRLLIAGDGDARAALERDAKAAAPGRVHFLGYHSRSALTELFSGCDLFLHPNPREPFGIGPLEAMAAGLGVIAPNSGGVTSYADKGNTWLVEATAEGFAAAVREAISIEAPRLARIENARATAQAHDWAHAADRYLRLYRDIHRWTIGREAQPGLDPLFVSDKGRAGTDAEGRSE
jgi:alpha-1,6-mannosyltransferase